MRDIEFRGYNTDYEEMTWFDEGYYNYTFPNVQMLQRDFDEHCGSGELWYWEDVTENMILMQYTGLKDLNNKKIYEGDIIYFSYDIFNRNFDTLCAKGIVVFEEGAFWVKPYEIENKKVNSEEEEWNLLYYINQDDIEVIGNIYENKELLEE